jgi:hypothetical protein
MARINPNNIKTDQMSYSEYEPIPPGEYLIAATFFKRQTTKRGDDMYRVAFEVLEGPFKGRKIYSSFFIDLDETRQMAIAKWAAFAQCAGVQDEFDTINEQQIQMLFLHKAVKAAIKKEHYKTADGRIGASNDIARFLKEFTPGELATKDRYDAAARSMPRGNGYTRPAQSAQSHAQHSSHSSHGSASHMPIDDSPFPQDDDIPF